MSITLTPDLEKNLRSRTAEGRDIDAVVERLLRFALTHDADAARAESFARLNRHFGSYDSGNCDSANNSQIDGDLAANHSSSYGGISGNVTFR